jgi:Fe-S cluster biogenesis protein NfuA
MLQNKPFNDIILIGDKMKSNEVELKIIALIDKIRPFLISDGGNLEFVKYENNIVYIRLFGACKDCSMIDITLKDGIEEMITSEIPEVKEVINLD